MTDFQHNKPKDEHKRQWLKTGLALGAGVAAGALGGFNLGEKRGVSKEKIAATQHSPQSYDCYGAHQAGITTPHQPFGIVCAFDITVDSVGKLENLFRTLTARIEALTQGSELMDTDPKLPPEGSGILGKRIPPDGLTITLGVGESLFNERYGLAAYKPKHLKEMKRFPNDKLNAAWCDGDLSIQICAFSPETCQNALRDLLKNTAAFASIRWTLDGWLPKSTPNSAARNLFGYHDGTGNPDVSKPDVANQVLWTGIASNSQDEPEWAKGGSYQAIRIIRQFIEFWDRTPLQEQNSIFGREKYSGAPLGMQHEHDTPDYQNDPDGKVIPKDSHMRLGNPRDPEFLKRHQILRRPFNYSLGLARSGQINVGLILVMYQANLDDGFIYVQNRLNGEPLEEYISPFGGGYFFILPGVEKGGFFGQQLISLVR